MENLDRNVSWKIKSAKKHKELALSYRHVKSVEKCPICNEIQSEKFVTIYNYDYLQCVNCGHIFLKDLIDKDSIKELYLGEENRNLQHEVYLSEKLFDKRVKQIANPKVQWILENVGEKGIWVDIGCGTGEILYSARGLGYTARGIDSDIKQIDFAKSKGLEVTCDYLNEINAYKYLKDGKIISLFNILEHLEKSNILLKNISANIDYGTYVVFEVPRHPSMSSLNNYIFNDMACRHIYPPDHIHIFTDKSAELMVKEACLEPISIWNFGQDIYDFIMTTLASRNIENNSFLDDVIEIIPVLQESIDKSGLSDTMIVICKK